MSKIMEILRLGKNRLDELLKKVKSGSVLYLCADSGLLRQVPQITGVNIAYREEVGREKLLRIGNTVLPIKTQYFYKPEQSEAEIVGFDENGDGVFFKYKYGKGFVFFLTLPLEAYLSSKHGAFFSDDQPAYDSIYRELAKTVKITRVCDTDHPYVRLTEHVIDEKTLYVVAINYNNKPAKTNLSISPDYVISEVFGEGREGNIITLQENDGIILKLERK